MHSVKNDQIFHNGQIITLDEENPLATAMQVKNGKIISVGSEEIIKRAEDSNRHLIDLKGATVIPGFNDTHAHMDREGLKNIRPSLAEARDIDDILKIISECAKNKRKGEWIVTMPVGRPPHYFEGPQNLKEKRMPNRQELDGAAPNNPVCISAVFGNWGAPPGYTALNTEALTLNNIDKYTTPRCSGVEVQKDENGEPNGIIIEYNSRPTVDFDILRQVPRFKFLDRLSALRSSMEIYNSVGTTSVYEGHGLASETIAAYRELWETNELTLRATLVLSPSWKNFSEAQVAMRDWTAFARGKGLGDPWLNISGIHIAFGGDPIVAEIARSDLPNTGWSGFIEQANNQNEFMEYCMLAANFGLRVNTIVGDQLSEVIDVFEKIDEAYPLNGKRWVIQHVARTTKNDLLRLRALGMLVTTIPVYYLWKGGDWYRNEEDLGNSVVPLKTMIDLGIKVSAGTDNIPFDPIFTLRSMMERVERISKNVVGPGQRLTGTEALKLLTREGAWLTFDEKRKGILKPGYFADMTVLSKNPCELRPAELESIQCLMTIVGGNTVYNELAD